jgi:mRNA-degrading endonuclease RelE of RelBE toxin-antitoxin system
MGSSRYSIEFTRETENDLDRLRGNRESVIEILLRLEEHPNKGHALQGKLKGLRSLEFSLPGSGVYRAVYQVQPDRTICLVVIIGPHENIYKKAERRVVALQRSGKI